MITFVTVSYYEVMGKAIKRRVRTQKDRDAILEKRFSYLPKAERDKLLYGNEFVEVPAQELARLRIDAYPYLM